MPFQKKIKYRTRFGESIILKLREEKRSSEEFEIYLSQLSLEELIGLKLELSAKMFANNKFYGFPLWKAMPKIVKDALLNFALRATSSQREAAIFLGIDQSHLTQMIKKFKIDMEIIDLTKKSDILNPQNLNVDLVPLP